MKNNKNKNKKYVDLVEKTIFEIVEALKKNDFPYHQKKDHMLDIIFIGRIINAMIDNHFETTNPLRPSLKRIHEVLIKQLNQDDDFNLLWKEMIGYEKVLN